MARRPPLITITALSVATACAGNSPKIPTLTLPQSGVETTLRIRDPLLKPELAVEGTLAGDRGQPSTLWMTIDSGASQLSVPRELQQRLGLSSFARSRVHEVGGTVVESVAIAPSLALGELLLSNVPVVLSSGGVSGHGIIGQSLLRQATWQVSWDLGMLALGATPWIGRLTT